MAMVFCNEQMIPELLCALSPKDNNIGKCRD